MPYLTVDLYSAETNANYLRINDIIGLIKNALSTCPLVTIVSDIVGSSSVSRKLFIQIGNSPRYTYIYATSYTSLTITLRNIANTSNLHSFTWGDPQNTQLSILWGANTFIMHKPGSQYVPAQYTKLSDDTWAQIKQSTSSPYEWCYIDADDTGRALILFDFFPKLDGSLYLYPIRFTLTSYSSSRSINDTHDLYCIDAFSANNLKFTFNCIVSDQQGNYYYHIYVANKCILFKLF